jgi:hypothetical protein
MNPIILFPDVELWASEYLRTALTGRGEPYAAGAYVSNAVPATRRPRMVIVRRDGGPRLDLIREAARLGVNVWAETDRDATDLARLVAALLWAAPDGNPVLRVTQNAGPTPVSDVSGKPIRYMTFELTVRGTEIE